MYNIYMCNAAMGTVHCCWEDWPLLLWRRFNIAMEIVQCCHGDCALLLWRLCNTAGRLWNVECSSSQT